MEMRCDLKLFSFSLTGLDQILAIRVFILLQADYFAFTGWETPLHRINIQVVCKGFVVDEFKLGRHFSFPRCFFYSLIYSTELSTFVEHFQLTIDRNRLIALKPG
jgi:hypothetical protein